LKRLVLERKDGDWGGGHISRGRWARAAAHRRLILLTVKKRRKRKAEDDATQEDRGRAERCAP